MFVRPVQRQQSHLVCGNKVLFGSADRHIYCLDETTGRLLWRQPTGQAVCVEPIASGDVVFAGSGDGKMRACNIESGAVIWTYDVPQSYMQTAATVLGDTVVFGASDGRLYASDTQLDNTLWTLDLKSAPQTRPLFAAGKLFVVTADGALSAVDAAGGQLLWRCADERFIASLGVSHDGTTLFARTRNGQIFAFDTTINGCKKRWKKEDLYADDCNPCTIAERNGKRKSSLVAVENLSKISALTREKKLRNLAVVGYF